MFPHVSVVRFANNRLALLNAGVFVLRQAHVPVTPREYLDADGGARGGRCRSVDRDVLSSVARAAGQGRAQSRQVRSWCSPRFSRAIAQFGSGGRGRPIPEEWLRKLVERYLSPEEKAEIEKLGFDKLMETLRQRLAEQKGATRAARNGSAPAGTSPFGAYGDNPEGVRIGQDKGPPRQRRQGLGQARVQGFGGRRGTRAAQYEDRAAAAAALRPRGRRRGTRSRRHDPATAEQGLYRRASCARAAQRGEGAAVPRRRRLDGLARRGGRGLFSAARSEFKRLEHFYFHNCLYESVWKNNRRRHEERTPTQDLINTYGRDYRVIFVGDAAMSPL
jgi:uncharacterized protein with von Willebrand factor type A (vWA) domain